jgi:BlaI family transcriptional regulator, penicillinase repressor
MAQPQLPKPTEAELEILRVLWANGPSTVRVVYDAQVANNKDVVYTTTLKIMQNMLEKGLVRREEAGRGHVYEAVATEESVQKKLIDRLLDTAFGGSAMKLVMQVLGNHQASEEELQQIRKLLDQKGGE